MTEFKPILHQLGQLMSLGRGVDNPVSGAHINHAAAIHAARLILILADPFYDLLPEPADVLRRDFLPVGNLKN